MMWKAISSLCVATVITQMVISTFLMARGSLNKDSVTQLVALAHGIDITGDRLRAIMQESQTTEIPSFTEVLENRTAKGLDAELRLQNQSNFYDQLQFQLKNLREREDRFDVRRDAFNTRLDELEKGVRDEGLQELKRTLEVLDANQAKSQLLFLITDGEIDTVVNIVQAMSPDKRKKIFGEFTSPDEQAKLAEILRRIGLGEPKKSLIENARKDD